MTYEPKSTEGDASKAVLWGLTSLDAEICKSQGGEPGSGIYALLDMLAGQFLGVPRGSYPGAIPPVDPPATQAAKEPDKHEPPKPSAHAPNARR